MPNNNPEGVNSFNDFAPEPAYGQATQQAQQQSGAPLASGGLVSGPITPAPPQKPVQTQEAPQPPQALVSPPVQPPANPSADLWAAVAATPGASDLVQAYAKQAQQ